MFRMFTIKLFTLFLATSIFAETPEKFIEQLKEHVKFNPDGPNTIGRILIEDRQEGINQSTWLYVKSALDHYKETKPIFIILELNTPGGEVFAAQTISDALKEMDTQFGIPVICYINNWAISAGAMLAYSCRFITVVKDASMGAAEPVIASETGEMKSASEKINSALRTDFANRAAFFDRNPYIAEAMVDKDMIVVLRDGKIIKLDNESQINTADTIISSKGKLLTLNSTELMQYGVADLLLPPTRLAQITPQEKKEGKWPANKELLIQAPFFNQIPNLTVDTHIMDWKTRFFAFLANPVVSSILFMGLMIGFYLELNSPGASLPGSIALISLFLIILSSFAQEIGNVLELILIVVGIITIIIELFVLPTFGLLGFVGILCFFAGLLGLMLPGLDKIHFEWSTSTFNAAGEVFMHQLAWLSGALLLSIIIMALLGKYILPSFGAFKRFVLSGDEQDASRGYKAVGYDASAIGKEGVVFTDLKPGGFILIDGQQHAAISVEGYLSKGKHIIVLSGEESNLIVRKL